MKDRQKWNNLQKLLLKNIAWFENKFTFSRNIENFTQVE